MTTQSRVRPAGAVITPGPPGTTRRAEPGQAPVRGWLAVLARVENAARTSAFNRPLHGARGLFSLMVFAFHIANSQVRTFNFAGSDIAASLAMTLQYGVELFFGISGIVILGAMARARSLRHYAWDRATRIYPVLWASVTVILIGLIARHQPPPVHVAVWSYVLPPPGYFPGLLNPASWSLSFEIAFYLMVGAGWTWRRHGGALAVSLAALLVMLAIFPRTVLMLPGVLIGAGLLDGAERWPGLGRLIRAPGVTLVLFLVLWRWIELLTGQPMMRVSPAFLAPGEWLATLPLIALAGALGTTTLLGIVRGEGLLGTILRNPAMQRMGTISYSFYLWHPVVLGLLRGMLVVRFEPWLGDATRAVLALVALPAALAVAQASHALLEVRLTRVLRRRRG